jgi:hypothetical protein
MKTIKKAEILFITILVLSVFALCLSSCSNQKQLGKCNGFKAHPDYKQFKKR